MVCAPLRTMQLVERCGGQSVFVLVLRGDLPDGLERVLLRFVASLWIDRDRVFVKAANGEALEVRFGRRPPRAEPPTSAPLARSPPVS